MKTSELIDCLKLIMDREGDNDVMIDVLEITTMKPVLGIVLKQVNLENDTKKQPNLVKINALFTSIDVMAGLDFITTFQKPNTLTN